MNQQERDEYLAIEWTGPGWKQIILDCDRELSALDPEYTIDQIKEKYGGLRYYISPSEDYMSDDSNEDLWAIEDKYEKISLATCESCGASKGVRTEAGPDSYWIKTICHECRQKGNTNEQ